MCWQLSLISYYTCICCICSVGVCGDGYASTSSNECFNCVDESGYLWIIFVIGSLFIMLVLFWFLWRSVKDMEKTPVCRESSPVRPSTKGEQASDVEDNGLMKAFSPIRYISSRISVEEVAKKIDLQAFTTNSITSFKLILSFYQIMTQVVSSEQCNTHTLYYIYMIDITFIYHHNWSLFSFFFLCIVKVFELDVDWPDKINIFFTSLIIHQPQYLSFSYCTTNDAQIYYDMMFFYIFMPLGCFVILLAMGSITYWFGIRRRAAKEKKSSYWVQSNVATLRTNIIRIMLIFCLTIFPIVTSEYLLFFDCRSFGSHGSYLREDYSVECYTNRYNEHIYLALFGILLFGCGIPIFFYYVVQHREEEVFANSSIVLHRSFKHNYKQFEIVALFHKVLIFSIVSFVARPGTSSQCLFLLLCNLGYLAIIALCKPYEFRTDTILALTFTSIECFAFLVAFLVISDVAEVEEYSMTDIYNVLYSFLIISVCLLTPSLYAMKYDGVNAIILKKTGIAMNRAKSIARRSTRRSSAFLSAIRSTGGESITRSSLNSSGEDDDDNTRIRKSSYSDSANVQLEMTTSRDGTGGSFQEKLNYPDL